MTAGVVRDDSGQELGVALEQLDLREHRREPLGDLVESGVRHRDLPLVERAVGVAVEVPVTLVDVQRRVGEERLPVDGRPADVIEVQVGVDDVGDVGGLDAMQQEGGAQAPAREGEGPLRAIAGVMQDELVAIADEVGADGVELRAGHATEMLLVRLPLRFPDVGVEGVGGHGDLSIDQCVDSDIANLHACSSLVFCRASLLGNVVATVDRSRRVRQ